MIQPGFRIPKALYDRVDKAWARRRFNGIRQTKQAFVADLLEVGLQKIPSR